MMARIRTNSRLQVQNRERVRKYRIMKKLRKNHEDHVRAQIQQLKPPTFDSEFHEPRSTDDGVEKNDFDIRSRLRIWAVTHRITHMAINDLLTILILAGFASLPKDSRTLMHTPVSVNITTLTNGKFWYQGLRECLGNIFYKIDRDLSIMLDFNVDGLPIFGSSKLQFWPILSAICCNAI